MPSSLALGAKAWSLLACTVVPPIDQRRQTNLGLSLSYLHTCRLRYQSSERQPSTAWHWGTDTTMNKKIAVAYQPKHRTHFGERDRSTY